MSKRLSDERIKEIVELHMDRPSNYCVVDAESWQEEDCIAAIKQALAESDAWVSEPKKLLDDLEIAIFATDVQDGDNLAVMICSDVERNMDLSDEDLEITDDSECWPLKVTEKYQEMESLIMAMVRRILEMHGCIQPPVEGE